MTGISVFTVSLLFFASSIHPTLAIVSTIRNVQVITHPVTRIRILPEDSLPTTFASAASISQMTVISAQQSSVASSTTQVSALISTLIPTSTSTQTQSTVVPIQIAGLTDNFEGEALCNAQVAACAVHCKANATNTCNPVTLNWTCDCAGVPIPAYMLPLPGKVKFGDYDYTTANDVN